MQKHFLIKDEKVPKWVQHIGAKLIGYVLPADKYGLYFVAFPLDIFT